MLNKIRFILAFGIMLLAGCRGTQGPAAPAPTPQILRLDITPASTWMLPAINECQQQIPGLNLSVREISTRKLDASEADLLILSGEPDLTNVYAVKIQQTSLVFIVNPGNSIDTVSLEQLMKILGGQVAAWSDVDPSLPAGQIHVWVPPTSDELWDSLTSTLMDQQSLSRISFFAPDPNAMLASIAADAYSIGILPQAFLNNMVKVLDGTREISIPLIAVSQSEPKGLPRDFLLCLQAFELP